MDDYRFRSQRSPRDDNQGPMSSLVTPPRNGRMSQHSQIHSHAGQQQSANDSRSNLPRRFTTESGRVPTLSSVGVSSPPQQQLPQQRGSEGPQDFGNSYHLQLIEKKKLEYERIRDQRRRFELEMARLDQEYRREARELAQMEEEVRLNGHQSEPTTPPEHHSENGFPSIFSRPSRYSMSSLASPPGFQNRPARSGSQLISPPSGMVPGQGRHAWDNALPSRSTPATRRNSDDEDRDDTFRQDLSSHRSAHAHRFSMPGSRPRNGHNDTGLDGTNTTRFLFGEDDNGTANTSDERFPTLVRRDDQILSASSAALDLALSSSPNPEAHPPNNWSNHINRHRTQQSMSSINGPSSNIQNDSNTLGHRPAALRHSLDLKYIAENGSDTPGNNGQGNQMATPPKLQSSYSSNDVPTVKNSSGANMANTGLANNHAQQHFHNHNASMGRIPAGATINRSGHSRELSADNSSNAGRDQAGYQSLQSALQPNAAPFGPSSATPGPMAVAQVPAPNNGTSMNAFNGYYPPNPNGYGPANGGNSAPGQYGMNAITAGMQQMNVNGGGVNGVNGNMYPGQNFAGYGQIPYNQPQQPRDSQARVIQNRRNVNDESMSRYHNMPLESFRGQIYELCKDQHGCRYLQRKLEERNPEQVHMIWLETNPHVVELMTDAFGNYLCQKLLEFCNDDERTVLIQNASKEMVQIALNTHGTRALQKMIEFVAAPQQVQLIIEALRHRVVQLIQDLNGNHVIQKCLNKLTPADAQFIFDAVGSHCVDVGTHRHGCCVLQRCIDHASGDQKLWLIQRITEQSRILVQDPFGNYVVQYIIDLNEPTFTEPIVATFQGCISMLSRHKFSSNVIEKCLRCAQPPSKDMIVEEMLTQGEPERLIRDSYANYVVQTALEYATPHQKHRLVEAIRPILPTIRNTPYGRRIQAKITTYDSRGSAASSGQVTPADNTQGQIPLMPAPPTPGMIGNGPTMQSAMQPAMQATQLPNNGGQGNQGMTQTMTPFQHNGVVSPSGPPGPGGNFQQPQFNQAPQNNFNGHHQTANAPSQGNGAPWM